MACCLTAPSHYLIQYWLLISELLWHSFESNFTASAQAAILYSKFENNTFQIIATCPRGQWVKNLSLFSLSFIHHSWDMRKAFSVHGSTAAWPKVDSWWHKWESPNVHCLCVRCWTSGWIVIAAWLSSCAALPHTRTIISPVKVKQTTSRNNSDWNTSLCYGDGFNSQ